MSLKLSNGQLISQTEAIKNERNILSRLRRRECARKFEAELWKARTTIEAIVARHLNVPVATCVVQTPDTWIRGQFNVCVFVQVAASNNEGPSRKVFRCPMPHKVGSHAEALDEKIRAEVANYAWIGRHCPAVPIAHMVGFGLGKSGQFTHQRHLSWSRRIYAAFTSFINVLRFRKTYPYFKNCLDIDIGPFMILDSIESSTGTMLSGTWSLSSPSDEKKQANLFRGLSRIILSLAAKPQTHIGSLRFEDNSTITLSNRPLLCSNVLLESEGAPRTIQSVYPRTDLFLDDMLQFREDLFLWQPNAVNDEEDCRLQMSFMMLFRLIMRRILDYSNQGPFVFQHTDLHASNIFVDNDWNITAIIDLEYVCALPPEMQDVPYWLAAESIDTVDIATYTKVLNAFMTVFEEEERLMEHCVPLGKAIRRAWDSGGYWCYHCLTSINGMPILFEEYIRPMYNLQPWTTDDDSFLQCLSRYWSKESEDVVKMKLDDKQRYNNEIQEIFAATEKCP